MSPDDIPRWGQWVELTLDLQRFHPEGSHPGAKRGKYAVPAGAPSTSERSPFESPPRTTLGTSGASRRTANPPNARNFLGEMDGRARGGARASNQTRPRVRRGWETSRGDGRQGTHGRVRSRAARQRARSDRRGRGHRTAVAKRTLDPVWGNGPGRRSRSSVAPARRRCSCCATTRRTSPGISFWAWAPCRWRPAGGRVVVGEQAGAGLSRGPSARAAHSGESTGFLVVRCAASSPMPRCETWPEPRRFWPNAASPPPPPSEPYLHKVQSSTFVYFQVCGARDLP